ncbi:ZrgA family zinc uptake protein, partial [Rhodomicrobium sp.]|uniref:ZrgA family zinc uptake protein n=1 Tax=Rhodomicrobium sp. TaxID=2720632 RepID=UPI0039E57821
HEHDKNADAKDDDHDHEGGEHHHSEFHVEYSFHCSAPEKITSLTFGYFKQFPNAQELDVSVITPKGQSSYEVTKDKPKLELKGV